MPLNDNASDDMPTLLRATAPRPGPATPDCLAEETVAALVDGALDRTSLPTVTAHLATCARCRMAVAAVTRMLRSAAVVRETSAIAQRALQRRWHLPLGVAAAAALVMLLVWPRGADDVAPVHRGPTITAATTPIPISPVGTVAEAARLQWATVHGADRYRVTIFDAAGRVVFETQLADTLVVLPDSIDFTPGQPYLWKVEARTSFDRWAASELVEFSLARAPPR